MFASLNLLLSEATQGLATAVIDIFYDRCSRTVNTLDSLPARSSAAISMPQKIGPAALILGSFCRILYTNYFYAVSDRQKTR